MLLWKISFNLHNYSKLSMTIITILEILGETEKLLSYFKATWLGSSETGTQTQICLTPKPVT